MATNTFSPSPVAATFATSYGVLKKGDTAVVVGAGSFGGWTALYLLRRGVHVTLVDAWGSGNSRSSSGDETRVIRSTYGGNEFYFDLNVRALQLWKEHERMWGRQVFHNAGVLWMCHTPECPLVDDSIPFARKHRMEYEHISKSELLKRYPLIHSDDLSHGWLDPFGGYLKARESAQLVHSTFVAEGGTYVHGLATPTASNGTGSVIIDRQHLGGDSIIYACGSWLGTLFPAEIGDRIQCSRQEAYYFGVPPEMAQAYERFPVWVDADGKDYYYGIPGNANRGFKVGVDRRGKPFDPTNGDRIADPEVLALARTFLSHRFPGLEHAPLVENRVCPYENSPDGNFIFERSGVADNVWFLGGGSGHGFKHGPALGELVASRLVV